MPCLYSAGDQTQTFVYARQTFYSTELCPQPLVLLHFSLLSFVSLVLVFPYSVVCSTVLIVVKNQCFIILSSKIAKVIKRKILYIEGYLAV